MRFLRKTILLLLLILCLAPLSTVTSEEGDELTGNTVTQHNEVCFTSDSSSLTTDFVLTGYTIAEVNDSISLFFEADVLNVTQNSTEVSLSDFTFSWEYFSLDNTTRVSEVGDRFSTHLETLSEEMGVLWSLSVTSNDSDAIGIVCIDAVFSLHIDAPEEVHEEEGSPIGNIVVSIIVVFALPSLVLIAFNRYS